MSRMPRQLWREAPGPCSQEVGPVRLPARSREAGSPSARVSPAEESCPLLDLYPHRPSQRLPKRHPAAEGQDSTGRARESVIRGALAGSNARRGWDVASGAAPGGCSLWGPGCRGPRSCSGPGRDQWYISHTPSPSPRENKIKIRINTDSVNIYIYMDEQDNPQTMKVYRLVKEGRTDETGFGGARSSWRMVGLPPCPGEGRSLLGAAGPELRQSHEAKGAGLWRADWPPERKTVTTSSWLARERRRQD